MRKTYSDLGGRGDIVVLLHGFPASRKYWRSTQKFLARNGYRVIAIDLLGFGNAPKPHNIEYSYKNHVAHIRSVLKVAKINKPITIIGHSMGGLLGARFAALYPEEVRQLILLHPPLYNSSEQAHKTIHDTGRFYRFILTSPIRNIAWVVLRPLSLFVIGRHTALSREKSLENIILGGEIFKDLDTLSTKTLLFVGTHDRPQYLSNLKNHQINKLVTLRMENVGHHSTIFHKSLVRKAILDFLNH